MSVTPAVLLPLPGTRQVAHTVRRAGSVFVLLAAAVAVAVGLAGCGRRVRPNVLLITLDTTRADHLGCYGRPLARTPVMDKLASEGVRCDDAVSAAPITLPSHSTILTGLYPPAHGVRDNGTYALGNDAVTLAERLHRVGYRTQAIVSALVLNRRYNLTHGFDGYDDDLWSENQPKLFLIRSRPGPKTAARAVRWLEGWWEERPRRPFFLWMHLFDAHQPYTVPAAERIKSPSVYDAEIGVLDQAVSKVIDELRVEGVLDDTLIVITADHGESLGEHGEKTHAIFIYDATVRVPLIWHYPRRLPVGKVYKAPVRTVDIVPTVLGILGLPGASETQGTDLGPAFRGEVPPPDLPQYSESLLAQVDFGMSPLFGIRRGGYKWIRAPRPEVYDLRRDPAELVNLYPREARRGAALDRDLEAVLADSRRRALAPQKTLPDEETRRSLRALGYLAPASEREVMAGLDPKDALPLYDKLENARHLAQQKRWNEAEAVLADIVAHQPGNVSALGVLALAQMHQGNLEGSRQTYLRLLAADPKEARVYLMLGSISMLEGDLDGAERSFQKALAISPGFVEALANLGLIAALHDDEAQAESYYRRAMAADPTFPVAYRRLADLYYDRGDFAKALELYRKALAEQPKDFPSIIQAGNCARRTGDRAAAARYFERAAELRPDAWVPQYNLACLDAVSGDAPRALSVLDAMGNPPRIALLNSDPDLAAVRKLPGFSAVRRKLIAAAVAKRRAVRADAAAGAAEAPAATDADGDLD